ncbi:MAG: 23S rRNA (guanosine(2251)-2'-O)-methyltransferase RlmB [Bacteroidetes bacterium]|nr:23S rRNA (guanosine(2251)-2'-O)-methyltransferase RlmB [Bacteroidota bacterium]
MAFNSPQNQLLFGTRAVLEAIMADRPLQRIYIQNQLQNPLVEELKQKARELQIPINKVQRDYFDRYKDKNHQGVMAEAASVHYHDLEHIVKDTFEAGKMPFLLILDHIVDVRNFGAICRTAEIAGVDAIIIPADGAAKINEDAMKTSAGALNHIKLCRSQSLIQTLVYLKESGIKIISASEKSDQYIYEVDMTDPIAIMMGSEEKGIARVLLKYTDEMVKIPQYGKIESLNVSVACGVLLYECIRQRNHTLA